MPENVKAFDAGLPGFRITVGDRACTVAAGAWDWFTQRSGWMTESCFWKSVVVTGLQKLSVIMGQLL